MSLSTIVGSCLAALFAMPAPDKWDFKHLQAPVSCRILAVTKTSIMVACLSNGSGYKNNQVVIFPFHFRLACGSFNQLELFERCCYTRDDLLVGDRIDLNLMSDDQKIVYCVSVSIRGRQDGILPPTRRYRFGDFRLYHERANAYAAERNDKIPVPRHLDAKALPSDYPAFDPRIPRKSRIAPWPAITPMSYIEYAIFLR